MKKNLLFFIFLITCHQLTHTMLESSPKNPRKDALIAEIMQRDFTTPNPDTALNYNPTTGEIFQTYHEEKAAIQSRDNYTCCIGLTTFATITNAILTQDPLTSTAGALGITYGLIQQSRFTMKVNQSKKYHNQTKDLETELKKIIALEQKKTK